MSNTKKNSQIATYSINRSSVTKTSKTKKNTIKLSTFVPYSAILKRRSVLVFAAVFAVVGSYLLFKGKAASISQIAVYTGPAGVTAHDNFSTWLGGPVPYTTDYVDYKQGWAIDFNPSWLTDPWSNWTKSVPGRRLVLGVPLLEEVSRGQFDQCSAGNFDQYFTALGQNLASRGLGNSIMRLGYEMNNPSIGPWEATTNPSGYKSCYQHLVGVMRAVPGNSFLFDWNPNSGVAGGTNLTKFDDYYPGDSVVDIIGLDLYDVKWMDTISTPEQRWNFLLNQPLGIIAHRDFANAHGKPISFPEWGLYAKGDELGGGGDDPFYIDKMADWFGANNVAYQSYFNVYWYNSGVLADFPNGQARYKARFSAPIQTDPTPPTQPTSLTSPSQTPTAINLSWTDSTDNTGVSGYDIYRNNIKVGTVATNSYSDTGLTASTTYTYYVIARDAAGNSSPASTTISAATLASVPSTTDTTAPIVSISSPANASTIGRSVAINASATDNVKVTKLEVWIDGSLKTSNTNSNTISYTWGSRKATAGAHTITIKAYDAAANIGQSSVTVYK